MTTRAVNAIIVIAAFIVGLVVGAIALYLWFVSTFLGWFGR